MNIDSKANQLYYLLNTFFMYFCTCTKLKSNRIEYYLFISLFFFCFNRGAFAWPELIAVLGRVAARNIIL